MDIVRLASTSASNLFLWNLGETEKLHEENGDGFRTSTWNYEGSCLASCLQDSDNVVLTYVKKNVCLSSKLKIPLGTVQAIQFPRTTAKLLTVATDKNVFLYDIGKQKIRQEFKNVHNVSCLAMNQADKYTAAGCTNGQIHILNTLTGRPAYKDPLSTSTDANVTSVKFNHLKQSLLGSSSDQGNVTFWDINLAKVVSDFHEHKAPSTGLAFSPVNEVLALSTGIKSYRILRI